MVNLVKLCVGITSINQLEQLQSMRRGEYIKAGRAPVNIHITRNKPKRRVRQKIIRIDDIEDSEGKKRCCLVLDPDLIKTEHRAYRPFQGWRYLEQSDAPADLSANQKPESGMPSEMEEELRGLGLL